jgi:hypothetical protein
MTILNLASDGLYPQLIALFRVVAQHGTIESSELIRLCAGNEVNTQLRASLLRWTELGLFATEGNQVSLERQFAKKRGETLDSVTAKLPAYCRRLILGERHCLPLWGQAGAATEDGTGRTADFARGMSWALAQDIYQLLGASAEQVEPEEHQQLVGGKFIFLNKTRWPALILWARYLGFATGDNPAFFLDPTFAVKGELGEILAGGKSISATDFVEELGRRLPVLDFGRYRVEVEETLNATAWRRPSLNHLSMSLSFALRRLQLDNVISLDAKADAVRGLALTGKGNKTLERFTHVRLIGDAL